MEQNTQLGEKGLSDSGTALISTQNKAVVLIWRGHNFWNFLTKYFQFHPIYRGIISTGIFCLMEIVQVSSKNQLVLYCPCPHNCDQNNL